MKFCWCMPGAPKQGAFTDTDDEAGTPLSKSKDAFVVLSSTDSSDGSLSYYSLLDEESSHVASDEEQEQPLTASFHEEEIRVDAAVESPPLDTIDVKPRKKSTATPLEQQHATTTTTTTTTTITDAAEGSSGANLSQFEPTLTIPSFDALHQQSPRSTVTKLEVIFEGEVLDEFESKTQQQVYFESLAPRAMLPQAPVLESTASVVTTTTTSATASTTTVPSPPPSPPRSESSKRATTTKTKAPSPPAPRPTNKTGDIFGARRRRRVQPEAANSATPVVINKDVRLENWLAADDMHKLWLEYNVRRSANGEKSPRTGQVLLCIGTYELRQGHYQEAVHHFKLAAQCDLEDHKRVEGAFVQAEARYNMGLLALEMNDLASAENFIAKALYLHQKNETNHDRDPNAAAIVGRSLHTLGVVRMKNGDLESALHTLQRAAATFEKTEDTDPLDLASIKANIGSVHFRAGDSETALNYHKQALKIKSKLEGERSVLLVTNYKALATVYMSMKKYNSATNVYIRAEAILRREYKRQQRKRNKALISTLACQLGEVHELLADAAKLRNNGDAGSAVENLLSRSRIYYEVAGERAKVTELAALIAEQSK